MLSEEKVKLEVLSSLVFEFSTKKKLQQGWRLFGEGEAADHVYLIKSGEIELSSRGLEFPK